MNRFLIETYLYFMDLEQFIDKIKDLTPESLGRLAYSLEIIARNEFKAVLDVINLAPAYIWRHYELTGITGQREQELLKNARRALKQSVAASIHFEQIASRKSRKRDSKNSSNLRDSAETSQHHE